MFSIVVSSTGSRRTGAVLQRLLSEANQMRHAIPVVYGGSQNRGMSKYRGKRDPFQRLRSPRVHAGSATDAEIFLWRMGSFERGIIGATVYRYESDGQKAPILTPREGFQPFLPQLHPVDPEATDDFLDRAQKAVMPKIRSSTDEYPEAEILEVAPEAANRRFAYVFVDTSKGVKNMARDIRVREQDGVLRTVSPSERDYFIGLVRGSPNKRPSPPPALSPMAVVSTFANFQHDAVLDLCVKTLYPYQAAYKDVHNLVYKDIDIKRIYSVLQETKHWVPFVMYLIRNNQLENLIASLIEYRRLTEAATVLSIRGKYRELWNYDAVCSTIDAYCEELTKDAALHDIWKEVRAEFDSHIPSSLALKEAEQARMAAMTQGQEEEEEEEEGSDGKDEDKEAFAEDAKKVATFTAQLKHIDYFQNFERMLVTVAYEDRMEKIRNGPSSTEVLKYDDEDGLGPLGHAKPDLASALVERALLRDLADLLPSDDEEEGVGDGDAGATSASGDTAEETSESVEASETQEPPTTEQ